ncbi:MAG: restriction endonuclease subunit S [Bacteroidota bacterium]
MKQGWEIKKLGEIAEYSIGLTYSPKDVSSEGIIVLRSSNIQEGKIDLEDLIRVKKKIKENLIVRNGDILMCSRNGSKRLVGKTATINDLSEEMTFGTFMTIIRSPINQFLSWFFISDNFREQIGGGENPMINQVTKYMLDEVKVPVPPLHEQQRIAAILDATFAAIAKAKANAEQNLKNAKELFESYLQGVFENKGEDWEEKRLGDVCELIIRGVSPKYLEKNGIIVLNQKCIRDHKISYEYSRFHDGESKKVSTEKMVKFGDVLINSTGTGTLGRVAQVRDELENVTVDSHVTIVRAIQNLFFIDFFGWALIFIEDEIAKRGEGCGGQTELARNTLKNDFSICFPKSLNEQQTIVQKLDTLSTETKKLEGIYQKKIEDLEELKKSVLQKAFSGELRTIKEIAL